MKNLLVLFVFIAFASCASFEKETLKDQNDHVIKHNNSIDRLK